MRTELGTVGSALLEATVDPVAILELGAEDTLRMVLVNPALAKQFGCKAEELSGADVRELYDPHAVTETLERVRWVLEHQRQVGYEVGRELPVGRHVYTGTAIPLSTTQVLVVEHDVSEERATALRLQNLERLTETGTWSWNLVDGEVRWSAQFRRIMGVGAGFRSHMDSQRELVHPEDRDLVRDALAEARATGQTEEFAYRIVRPNGEQRHVCGRATRAVDRRGEPVRVYGTVQDVTERRALEASEEARQRMGRQQARALQLNDDVIQSLARAWLALDLDRPDDARDAVTEGMETVRRIVGELLQAAGQLRGGGQRGLQPGDLAHMRAARMVPDKHPA